MPRSARSIDSSNRLIPAHVQLKQVLLADIEGAAQVFRLPSIRDLMKRHRVSQTTVEKALMELEKDGLIERRGTTGIFADPHGRLVTERSTEPTGGLVGVMVHDLVNFFPPIVRALRQCLRRHGYQVLTYAPEHGDPQQGAEAFVDVLRQNEAAGAVLAPRIWTRNAVDRLRAEHIPLVAITQQDQEIFPCVCTDDHRGGALAAEHLLGQGHRRIAVSAPSMTSERVVGFLERLESAGVVVDEAWLLAGPRHREAGALRTVLEHGVTACFAYNDVAAIELHAMARALGHRVPEDLSVVGYDDSEIIRASGIPLTTVAQPLTGIGHRAGQLLLAAMAGDPTPQSIELLPPELVARATTATLPQDVAR